MRKTIIIVAITIFLSLAGTASAAPKAEKVDKNSWFKSGGFDIVMNKVTSGKKTKLETGTIKLSRTTAPDWDDSFSKSYEWNISVSGSNKMKLPNSKCKTFKYYTFNDDAYERSYTNEPDGLVGFRGFEFDINITIPKGLRYIPKTTKANTKLDGFALMLIMPKEAYNAANNDRTFKAKLIFHSAQSGVMSLDKVRYSGNSIEFDMEQIEPESITLDQTEIVGKIGETKKLTPTIKPDNAFDKSVTYTSSNQNVATVSADGTITFKAEGNANVIAKTSNGKTVIVKISSYKEIKEKGLSKIEGFTRSETILYAIAGDSSGTTQEIGQYENLSIIGQCGNYYYVEMDNTGEKGFVLKKDIEIPIVDFTLSETNVTLLKGLKKTLRVTYIPSITTQREVIWSSGDSKVASVSNSGQISALSKGNTKIKAEIKGSKVRKDNKEGIRAKRNKVEEVYPTHYSNTEVDTVVKGWVRLKNIKEVKGEGNKMQGVAGVGNKMYFVKIKKKIIKDKKKNKKKKKVEIYANIYRATISGGKISKPKNLGKIKQWKSHYNSIAAVPNGKYHEIYYTSNKEHSGFIRMVKVKKNGGIMSKKTIKCKGKYKTGNKKIINLSSRVFHSIAYKAPYFILKSGEKHFVCKLSKNRKQLELVNAFTAVDVHKYKASKTTIQGSSCTTFTRNNYYFVCYSYAFKSKSPSKSLFFSKLSGISYVYRYRLKNRSGGGLIPGDKKVFELRVGKKVPWKTKNSRKKMIKKTKVKKPSRKLELEGLHIYKNMAYFTSEGSDYCADIIGKYCPF